MADTSDDVVTEPVVFKKPARKNNIRKRSISGGDEDHASSDSSAPSLSLEVIREIQRNRNRNKGVTLEVSVTPGQEEVQEGVEDEENLTLDNAFTAETDAGEVDPSMLKYIEEQMSNEKGEANSGAATSHRNMLGAEEAELYVTPAHLQGRLDVVAGTSELEDANRWLAGIMEVPLSAEDKMHAIEQTESAKRKMMQKKRLRGKGGGKLDVVIPTNYNANFHGHRREFVLQRPNNPMRVQTKPGENPLASDAKAFDSFKKHDRMLKQRR